MKEDDSATTGLDVKNEKISEHVVVYSTILQDQVSNWTIIQLLSSSPDIRYKWQLLGPNDTIKKSVVNSAQKSREHYIL